MAARKTNVPAIPNATTDPASLQKAVSATKEAVEVGLGRRGDPMDRFVTLRDLSDAKVVNVSADGAAKVLGAGASAGDRSTSGATQLPRITPDFGTKNYAKPTAPNNVHVVALPPDGVALTFDPPGYSNHAYAEVFRMGGPSVDAPTFQLAADGFNPAKPVGAGNVHPDFAGAIAGTVFTDPDLTRGVENTLGDALRPPTYWYWVRFVSTAGVPGPFAPLNGAAVQLAVNPQSVLGMLVNSTKDQSLYRTLVADYFGTDAWDSVLSNKGGLVQYIQSLDAAVRNMIDAQLVRLIGASDQAEGAASLIKLLDAVTGVASSNAASLNDVERWQAALASASGTATSVVLPIHQYRNRVNDEDAQWWLEAGATLPTSIGASAVLDIDAPTMGSITGKRVRVASVQAATASEPGILHTSRTCVDGTALPVTVDYTVIDGTSLVAGPQPDVFVNAYTQVYRNVMVRVDPASAIAKEVGAVSAAVGEVSGEVQTNTQAIANLDGTQDASWTVRMRQLGSTGLLASAGFGLGLQTTANPDGTFQSVSTFAVDADQFAVMGKDTHGASIVHFATLTASPARATVTLSTASHGLRIGGRAVFSAPALPAADGTLNPMGRYAGLEVGVVNVSGAAVTVQRDDAAAFSGDMDVADAALLAATSMPFLIDTRSNTVGVRGSLIVDGLLRATTAELDRLTATTAFVRQLQAEIVNANVVIAQRLVAGVPGSGVVDTASVGYRSNYVVELNNPLVSSWPLRYWKPSTGQTLFGLSHDGDVFVGGNLSVGANAVIATTGDHVLSVGGAGADTGGAQYDLWVGPASAYGARGERRSETNGMLWAKTNGRVGINADVFLGNYPLSPPDASGNITVRPSRDGSKSTVFCSAVVNLVPDQEANSHHTVLGVRLWVVPSTVSGDARSPRPGTGLMPNYSRANLDAHVRMENGDPPWLSGTLVSDTQVDYKGSDIVNVTLQGAARIAAGKWKVMMQVWRQGPDDAGMRACFGGYFFAMIAR